jgi:quinolinate synthase
MEPILFGLSAPEEQGDSLALSRYAATTKAEYIIFNGVFFMAETAKILSPQKRVLIADKTAGCSLADDFDSSLIDELRAAHPGVPVMIYVNSSAADKAKCDVVCTSANTKRIAMAMPGDKIIFVPDVLFARNLAEELEGVKEVIYPQGEDAARGAVCEVHDKFTLADILAVRKSFEIPKGHPARMIYAHWECRPEVLREVDFYGSTSQIMNDIAKRASEDTLERAFVASECEFTSNLDAAFPQVAFFTACAQRCQHMAKVSLAGVLEILRRIDKRGDLSEYEVLLEPDLIERARKPIDLMLKFV